MTQQQPKRRPPHAARYVAAVEKAGLLQVVTIITIITIVVFPLVSALTLAFTFTFALALACLSFTFAFAFTLASF
jgi:uncharacterized membrane protein